MNANPLHALSHSLDLLKDTYNYNHWIYSLLRKHLGDEVCEVGAGIGNLTQFFLGARRLLCVEPDAEYFGFLEKIAAIHRNVEVFNGDLDGWLGTRPGGEFDSVVCVNVLEHIEDDVQALKQMKNMLRQGGRVLLYVPAAPWAYGQLDIELGHYRRYSKGMIRKAATAAGLEVDRLKHVNFIGVWGWFLHACILRRKVVSPQSARLIDRLVPFISALERIVPIPAGQSILAILRKQDSE
jgi:SAM-dependent methyltransferase